ncbi:sigma-54 dependent transcriptional regulator, partial [Aneurinibacillus aneurinilyticus]|nr:sigma-54 dependent transcriptional regulator [Aneurinibacillus aneurinilyticus]
MYHVMVIDDEPTICQSLTFALEDEYHVYAFTDPREALPLLERTEIAIVLLDLKIGEYDGMKILEEIKRISPSTIVIIMTAYGSIPSSVEAMRKGAFSYATKPLHIDELEVLMQKAEEVYALQSKVRWLSDELEKVTDNNGLIGESAAMREVFTLIDKVKDIGSNILITGESGTGKEVVARTIHYESKRRNKRFQAINCAAIPSHLLESELFGHEKGAFTGALQRKAGLFVLADGGTIFLDEIGEMDLALQGKLLRVLQERKVMPVGGTEEIEIDVRIVAATNRDLAKEVKENRFREDLYYRLNVIPMHLPPLRERKEDIPLLVKFFIRKIGDKMGKPVEGIAEEALRLLQQYSFPGNIRELQNMIERAIALTNSSCIQKDDLPA